MKLVVLAGTVLFAASGVLAADYVWTGDGTAGDWTSSANWGVESGYPQAGDTATFNADVTITSDFSLGGEEDTDILKITVASGVTLTVNASISGTGGVTREGSGTLVLKKSNPFTGKFKANGWTNKTKTNPNILTIIYNAGALGVQMADFSNGYDYGYSALQLDMSECADHAMTIAIPLKFGNVKSQTDHPNIITYNGNVTFESDVDSGDRLIFGGDKNEARVIRFKGKVTTTGYFQPNTTLTKKSHVYLENEVYAPAFYLYNTTAVYHFGSQEYPEAKLTGSCSLYGTSNVCERADVFVDFDNKGFPWSSHNSTDGGRIDLNGYDQHFPKAASGSFVCRNTAPIGQPISNYGFTSPAGKPAQVILEGTKTKPMLFNGKFYGTAGFTWNPDNTDAVFTFSNAVSTTSGRLAVSNGIVRLFDGASFTALSKLTVAATATLSADEKSAKNFWADEITVATGGKLALADGVTLKTEKLVVGETEVTLAGRYTAADYPALIEGAGAIEIPGEPCTWVGANGGLWSEPTNWSGDAVPGLNSEVTIPSGKSVVIDATNAEIYRLTIGGGSSAATLTMTNWTTCLQAREINVLNKGSITTMGAFTNDTEKSRVWIKCRDFTLSSGATIAMDGKGWMGGHYDLTDTSKTNPGGAWYNDDGVNHGGWGPGRTKAINAGASHLGKGCNSFHSRVSPDLGLVYDDPYAPSEPGSGGYGLTQTAYSQAWEAIGSGGGAVRIEASGAVVINGRILASGRSSSTHSQFNGLDRNYRDDNNQAGSGGAVWINCATIAGTGEIHADGGNGGWGLGTSLEYPLGINSTGTPGGGGGVAIVYDSTKQTAGAIVAMRISAAAGHYIRVENSTMVNDAGLTWSTVDDCWRASEPGTLYLADSAVPTDTKLIDDTLGKGLTGRLFSLDDYTYTGDLDWEYGYVRFGATGAVVNVTGNLTVTGAWSRIDLGGSYVRTNRTINAYVDAGDEPLKLNVGGDLTVSNGALVAVYAAQVANELTDWGAEVTVDGAFTIGDGGRVRPISNLGFGGAPRFLVGSFALEAGGKVDAVGRGCAGGWTSSTFSWAESHNAGIGFGAGTDGHVGSSHGGKGGRTVSNGTTGTTKPSAAVDDGYRPQLSGAGGGSSGYDMGGNGGGVFHLTATDSVRVDGEIDVSGLPCVTYDNTKWFDHFSSGAGGTIHLAGSTFAGAATAKLTARGGNAIIGRDGYASGGGGGGRIALWFGQEYAGVRNRVRHATVATASSVAEGFANWHGSVDVGGGTNAVPCNISYTLSAPLPDSWGEDGTVTYNGLFKAPGLSLIVQ